jgi:Fur family ferric uptake transcriptional regulator
MESHQSPPNTHDQPDQFKILLNQEGLRLTNQRQKILEIFTQTTKGYHLSAEDIYQHLSSQGERISFSTIYRALHILVNLGVLREIELIDHKKYYELNQPNIAPHHHLVCIQCGAVTEFEEDSIIDISRYEAESRNFSMLSCQFTIYGLCTDCQSSDLWSSP